MVENEEELKSIFMKVKVENEKVGLTLNIQKMKIMASGPITSWEIGGETVETMSDIILGGSKFTVEVTICGGANTYGHIVFPVTVLKRWTGRNGSWNQDFREKYQ